MGPLTDDTPKPMLKVAGETLLERQFGALPDTVEEIIIVVGYLGSCIQNAYGGRWRNKRILYVEQETLNGTAGALWSAKELLHDSFLVLHADNLYSKETVAAVARRPWCVAGIEKDSTGNAAKLIVDAADQVIDIIETEEHDKSAGFLNTGLYHLDMRVFDLPPVPKSPGSTEFGLPQTIMTGNVPPSLVRADFWIEITSPDDLKRAEKILKEQGIV